MRDVAHVHDGFQVQTNSVSVNGTPGALMIDSQDRRRVDARGDRRRARGACSTSRRCCRKDVTVKALFDQSVFVKAALNSVLLSACMAAGLTALVIILFLGNVRLSVIILAAIPLSIVTRGAVHQSHRADAEHHDLGRICAGNRHSRRQRHGGHREHRAPRRDARTAASVDRGRAPARWRCRRFCRRCAFASSSCRYFCCKAPPSICSRRCRSR